ncbi:MAG: hypothetical protein AAF653_09925 [Chloroflexota bacterium]
MAWNEPRTWAVSEMLTADLLNQQIRDNMEYLKVSGVTVLETASSNGGTIENSDDWTDLDNTNLLFSLTPSTGQLLLHLTCQTQLGGGNNFKAFLGYQMRNQGVQTWGSDIELTEIGYYSPNSVNTPVSVLGLIPVTIGQPIDIKLRYKRGSVLGGANGTFIVKNIVTLVTEISV